MKKMLCVLGLSLIVTGCTSTSISTEDKKIVLLEKEEAIIDSNEKAMYVDEDLKEVISEINSLRDKYKNSMDENSSGPIYIDIYSDNNPGFSLSNTEFNSKYFDDVVDILDKSIAKGLKDYIKEIKDKEIEDNKVLVRKIGRSAVYAEDIGEYEDNIISIKINFSDLKDKDYSELFNGISNDKYFLNQIIMGDKLNMIDFSNLNNYYLSSNDHLSIRYNMYLKDQDIQKVNILMQGKNDSQVEQEDIEVFSNLLTSLKLKEEDKDLLLTDYKGVFGAKSNNKKISLDDYNVLINSAKGNSYLGKDSKLIYFSIEKS